MKKLTTLILMVVICGAVWGQTDDLSITQKWSTFNTSNNNFGKWTKIAECNIYHAWQDFGSIIDFFGNGSGNSTIYYGRLVARFKNQNGSAQPVNIWNLKLFDSNIGIENIKAVRIDKKVEVYVRIQNSYTTLFYRQIINGSTPLSLFSNQVPLDELPQGHIINCSNGNLIRSTTDNFTITGSDNSFLKVANTNRASDSEVVIKAAYAYEEVAKTRSARLELGTHDIKGQAYYGKVWAIESITGSTWANSPEFRINQGTTSRFRMNYLGNIGIGKAPSSEIKLDVEGAIRATEIRVEANDNTADFVFEDNYHLKDLSEVEAFIKTNKHLPEIPSAEEMEEAGVNLAEMNKLLLMKVEELTLYAIEQNAEAERNEAEVERLKAEGWKVRSSESEVRKEI
jgi:hypothetical protein